VPAPDPSVPPTAYAFKVVGDSMDKIVRDGATIIIDAADRDLWPGELYVVSNGEGDATFKQYLDSPARLVPCSNNPEHKTIPVNSSGWEVLGKVIWIAMRPRYAALD
jgi:SOS-response transcriptional repressor LexA